jgi:hypothetical protein
MRRCWAHLLVAITVLLGSGCAGDQSREDGPVSKPTTPSMPGARSPGAPSASDGSDERAPSGKQDRFPGRDKLDAIVASPAPALPADQKAEVTTWQLRGPLPDVGGDARRQPEQQVERWLAERVRDPQVHLTEGLHCAARELALVKLKEGVYASPRLQRFIAGRCGVTSANLSMSGISGEVPVDIDEAEVHDGWGDGMRKMLDKLTLKGALDVGVALVRHEGQVAVLAVSGQRLVDVSAFSLRPDTTGTIVIEGRMTRAEPGRLYPWLNHGQYGARRCLVDVAVPLPSFRITCRPNTDDETAWLVVSFHPQGRLFGRSLVTVALRPSAKPGDTFKQERYGVGRASTNEEVLAALNQVRAAAGMSPLRLAVDQSAAAQRLAPHFLGAMLQTAHEPRRAEEIYLGLLAGWDVHETIENADLTWAASYRAVDLGQLMLHALELPQGRRTLLNPDADLIAIGRHGASPGVTGALFASYTVFDGLDVAAATKEVWDFYQRQREQAGLPPAAVLDLDPDAVAKASAQVSGGEGTDPVLRGLMELASEDVGKVKGWVFESLSLTRLKFPPAMMAPLPPRVQMTVAYRKPPDSSWGRYVVLVVIEDKGDLKTALLAR